MNPYTGTLRSMRNFALNIPRSLQQHPPPTLSRAAKQRLQVLDWYRVHGENARLTCRHFGISPDTFYRWKRRYNPKALTTLESRSHRPHHLRQPTWSTGGGDPRAPPPPRATPPGG